MNPLCFVLMPFGKKLDQAGRTVDFDAIYGQLIRVAIERAELDPIRADEEQVGGSIHKPMFERLLLCEYAVADLTGANPNVYYELGVRHALRPRSTLILFAEGTLLPFDVAPLRGMPYPIGEDGAPRDHDATIARIEARLKALRQEPGDDSPVYQLIENMPRVEVDHEKTDLFRERVRYSKDFKARLAQARRDGRAAVQAIASGPAFRNPGEVEAGVLVDVFLSLRDVEDHQGMIDWFERLPAPLQRTKMMQEQRAFALNRVGRSDEAEGILREVIADHGPSSETNGLLGRIYKDRWAAASRAGERLRASGEIRRAAESYLSGFEADWRDPYPGVNALTMMELQDRPDPRQAAILPVVRYAASRRAARASADYWDHATLVELDVLGRDEAGALAALENAVPLARAGWELRTTAGNLEAIADSRVRRGEASGWLADIVAELNRAAGRFPS